MALDKKNKLKEMAAPKKNDYWKLRKNKNGAPLNNQFWKLRSKHGRDLIFKTPELLMTAALEYFQYCEANPWIRHEPIKAGADAGQLIEVPTSRPYTIKGLCIFLGVYEKYFNDFKSSLIEKEDEVSKLFLDTIALIQDIVYTQKFEGASVGIFNSTIIARDLGLRDNQDITSGGLSAVESFSALMEKAQRMRVNNIENKNDETESTH
jgi:hypothetical protein